MISLSPFQFLVFYDSSISFSISGLLGMITRAPFSISGLLGMMPQSPFPSAGPHTRYLLYF